MVRVLFVCAVLLWAGAASAADQPLYGPAPQWVKPLAIPKPPADSEGAAVQFLLQDSQSRFEPDADETYGETAIRILQPQALGPAGNIAFSWNPDVETITIHKLQIVRDGKVIDILAGGKKLTVIRRETSLELAMLDGTLTATIQPEDLRVGDILDFAVTRRSSDPVLQGRSQGFNWLSRPGAIGRFHVRDTWPSSKPIRWRATEDLPAPIITRSADGVELTYDMIDARAARPPTGAPARFNDVGALELSQFADWAELSNLMAPLYRKASTLTADSPLRAEIAKIRAASTDPKARAAAALKLVQEQTRYVFLGMNFGGYTPANADVTWSRRFGDCKGKTVLLLSILQALGIEAEPAVVNSGGGDGLDQRLPLLAVFDHVLVRAVIGGHVYWLDGTRSGDRTLDELKPPPFRWALPLRDGAAGLERIDQPPFDQPQAEELVRFDASAGIDAPAPAHLEWLFRGDDAITYHLQYAGLDAAEAERSQREYWNDAYPWITPRKVAFTWDEAQGTARLSMDGSAKMDWSRNGSARDFQIGESSLGWDASFKRVPGPHQDAPFAVNHPKYRVWTMIVTLPGHGAGFNLLAAQDVDKVIAAVAYKRKTRLENGVVTMVASERSLAPEFPAAEAESAAPALRELWRYDVTIRSATTYSDAAEAAYGGPLSEPVDVDGFSRRGVMYLLAKDYDHAIVDFTAAARLDPKSGKLVYNRGVAYHAKGQDNLALADFDQALRLKADDVLALMARAELLLAKGDEPRARKDFDRAVSLSPGDQRMLTRRAEAYDRSGRLDAALGYFDDLIKAFPHSDRMDHFLASRCSIAARRGRDLYAGLADCNASLDLKPATWAVLQSRGLVKLRLGRLDQAISDYDDALRLRPDTAWAIYGRALAELGKGMKAEGDSDVASAVRLDPNVAAEFAAFGVKP